jgi:hypothetical protein
MSVRLALALVGRACIILLVIADDDVRLSWLASVHNSTSRTRKLTHAVSKLSCDMLI